MTPASHPTRTLNHRLLPIQRLLTQGAPPQSMLMAIAEAVAEALPGCWCVMTGGGHDPTRIIVGPSREGHGQAPASPPLPATSLPPQAQRTWWSTTDFPSLPPARATWARTRGVNQGMLEPMGAAGTWGIFWSTPAPKAEAVIAVADWAHPLLAFVSTTLAEDTGAAMADRARPHRQVLQGMLDGRPLTWIMDQLVSTIEGHVPTAMGGIIRWEAGIVGLTLQAAPHVPEAYRVRAEACYRERPQPLGWAVAAGQPIVSADIAMPDGRICAKLPWRAGYGRPTFILFWPLTAKRWQPLPAIFGIPTDPPRPNRGWWLSVHIFCSWRSSQSGPVSGRGNG